MGTTGAGKNSAIRRIEALEVGKLIWAMSPGVAATLEIASHPVESIKWAWGTAQGEFNQKQTVGQILADAVISMFPVLGEATAVRDVVAIVLRMCRDPQKAKEVMEWVSLVLCVIVVVPAVGGVLKGVGKFAIRMAGKGEDAGKLARAIVRWLNKTGHGNAVRWARELKFASYQAKAVDGAKELLDRLARGSQWIAQRASWLPGNVRAYLNSLPKPLRELENQAPEMVPKALRALDECMDKLRPYLKDEEEARITVGQGTTHTMEREARAAHATEWVGRHPHATLKNYRHKMGWPDLRKGKWHAPVNEKGVREYRSIESFSKDQQIVAETLAPGEYTLARVLDSTKGIKPYNKIGYFWLPALPRNGRLWRILWAVKQGWSKNGKYIKLDHIPTADELRARGILVPRDWAGLRVWKGQVASQFDEELGRELEGGATQYLLELTL